MTAHFRRWRKIFWRWHRRIGICSLFFLAFMAITGIAINHERDWSILNKPLPYWLASSMYAVGNDVQVQFKRDDLLLTQSTGLVALGTNQLDSQCQNPISDVLAWQGSLFLLCGTQIEHFDESGAFIESIPTIDNHFASLGYCGNLICLKENTGDWVAMDLFTLELLPPSDPVIESTFTQVASPAYPEHLKITPAEFNYARLLADMHNGNAFGRIGSLLVDLSGLIILLLSITGCYLWLGNRRR